MTERTILYIEDSEHNRRIVRKLLNSIGFNVIEAEDGLEGYEMLKDIHPPIVLLDISLPSMDGIEIAQRTKADPNLQDIILIALTASAMRGDRERFLAAGCNDYLSKPFRAVELLEIVQRHFAEIDRMEEEPERQREPQIEEAPLQQDGTEPLNVLGFSPLPTESKEPHKKPPQNKKKNTDSTSDAFLENEIQQNINTDLIDPAIPDTE